MVLYINFYLDLTKLMADSAATTKLEAEFKEYVKIEKAIKEYNAILKKLKNRKKELLETMTTFLEETDQPGFICGSSIVFCNKKPKRIRKKKTEKEKSALDFLKSKGITADPDFLNEFLEAMKGEVTSTTELKVKTMDKK